MRHSASESVDVRLIKRLIFGVFLLIFSGLLGFRNEHVFSGFLVTKRSLVNYTLTGTGSRCTGVARCGGGGGTRGNGVVRGRRVVVVVP